MTVEFHPFAEPYPLIEGEEFEQLVSDIEANGLRNPVWIYQGKILDGRNRFRACKRLGIDPAVKPAPVANDAEALAFVESQNDRRRHESKEARNRRWAERHRAGESLRSIAESDGVQPSTVNRAIVKVLRDATPPPTPPATPPSPAATPTPPPIPPAPAKVKGLDGKDYPATKPRPATPKPAAPAPQKPDDV